MRYEEFIKMSVADYLKNGSIDADSFPDFELYIDQATNFLNMGLSAYVENNKNPAITKAMINNYSKRGIVPRPVNKKYSKEHMILFAMVFYLKGLFPFDEIETLMKPIIDNYNSDLEDKIDLENIYRFAMETQEEKRANMLEAVENETERIKKNFLDVGLADDQLLEIFTLIVSLTLKAEADKYLASALLKEYFVKPANEKAEKIRKTRQEKEAEKAAKIEAMKDRQKEAVRLLELDLDEESL